MEDAMLKFCIVTAGAALIMVGSASAQTAGSAAPGKPISLLQVLLHPAKAKANAKTKPHTKLAHSHTAKSGKKFASRKTHLAVRREDPAPSSEVAAPEAATATVWPAVDTNSSAAVAPELAAASAPDAQSSLSEMVVDGRTVQIAAPDEVNAIDLAADEPHEIAPVQDSGADRDQPSAAFVALARQDDGDKSRDAWYEELLATLGGALAAGSVAWLLIGFAPPRRDGRDRMLIYETERMTR
jgi:hypothetical protein